MNEQVRKNCEATMKSEARWKRSNMNGHEPDFQGQMDAVHDRACRHRSLLLAGRTFLARPATLLPPPQRQPDTSNPSPACERLNAGNCRASSRRRARRDSRRSTGPALQASPGCAAMRWRARWQAPSSSMPPRPPPPPVFRQRPARRRPWTLAARPGLSHLSLPRSRGGGLLRLRWDSPVRSMR